jgi:ferrous iron transport protein A
MTLEDGIIGKEYIVHKSTINQPEKRRLEALGLIEGTRIQKTNENRDGSIIFKVRGTRLAVGKQIAQEIFVKEVE